MITKSFLSAAIGHAQKIFLRVSVTLCVLRDKYANCKPSLSASLRLRGVLIQNHLKGQTTPHAWY